MSSYRYYPPSSSGSVEHVRRPVAADDGGRGSFGPVLVVLAVVSFLSVAACVAGRVCGRGSSSTGNDKSSGSGPDQKHGAEAGDEKGHLAIMRPVPSSRATVHDVDDDAFEIKLLPPKSPVAAREATRMPYALPRQQQHGPPPRQFVEPAGFRAPLSGGAVRQQAHPPAGRTGVAFIPAHRCNK